VNWETDVFAKKHIETSIASPIVAGDLVIGSSGWLGVRQEVIAVRPPLAPQGRGAGGEGSAQPTTVYTLAKSAPLVPTPLAHDGLVFLWNDDGVVTCCDAATGKMHWRERVPGEYYSSPIAVSGHVLNVSRDGEVVVLKAARAFEHVATNHLGEGSHSTPAVARGRIYFRTFRHLIGVGSNHRGAETQRKTRKSKGVSSSGQSQQ
jgi:outer membrane protein assembly factor BamB